jgi:hypothetical protein
MQSDGWTQATVQDLPLHWVSAAQACGPSQVTFVCAASLRTWLGHVVRPLHSTLHVSTWLRHLTGPQALMPEQLTSQSSASHCAPFGQLPLPAHSMEQLSPPQLTPLAQEFEPAHSTRHALAPLQSMPLTQAFSLLHST